MSLIVPQVLSIKFPSIVVHWKKKCSHFDLKSWVTGRTKIRSGFRVIEKYFSEIDSILRVNLTQILQITRNPGSNFSSVDQWLNFLGQNDSIFSFSVLQEHQRTVKGAKCDQVFVTKGWGVQSLSGGALVNRRPCGWHEVFRVNKYDN